MSKYVFTQFTQKLNSYFLIRQHYDSNKNQPQKPRSAFFYKDIFDIKCTSRTPAATYKSFIVLQDTC